jgi:ABC-2 type transport system ATP-binding protein
VAEHAIVARDIVKRYGQRTALDGLTLTVPQGEILALLGPNGAGKTTFLEILEGLRRPDQGSARVLGEDPATPAGRRAIVRRIGISLQSTALWSELTVYETLALYATFYAEAEHPDALIDRLELTASRQVRVGALSGGQQQRLAIALALVNRPDIVFLDEPTTGLDPAARRSVWEAVRSIAAEGRTIVLTTHYMEEAAELAHHVAIMDRGRIVAEGTPGGIVRELGLGVTVRVRGPGLSLTPELLPGAERVEALTDGWWQITADKAEPVVEALFAVANQEVAAIEHLSVEPATLEDAFLHLTGRTLA